MLPDGRGMDGFFSWGDKTDMRPIADRNRLTVDRRLYPKFWVVLAIGNGTDVHHPPATQR